MARLAVEGMDIAADLGPCKRPAECFLCRSTVSACNVYCVQYGTWRIEDICKECADQISASAVAAAKVRAEVLFVMGHAPGKVGD